jgi:xylan 1,4-beta-xylosidase
VTDERVARHAEAARADWVERIGDRRAAVPLAAVALEAPTGLRADGGRAQVTLDWDPVDGAAGYLVYRAPSPDGPFAVVDFGSNDVLAVPHPPFTDSTGDDGAERWYCVAAVADIATVGPRSEAVAARPDVDSPATVAVGVDASSVTGRISRPWRPMIGSEHLSHLLCTDTSGGRPIGRELGEALRICRDELGVETVRAHAILGDDLGTYREVDGRPVHDFAGIDRVYDHLLDLGLRPVVELSYMPNDLAADPSKTVFAYGAIVSPPKDWDRWGDLVSALTEHLVERYGGDEVRQRWSFEVWNEPNLEAFWSGTPEEYLRLYDVSVRAVRAVDDRLVVGGPATAAVGWVDQWLGHLDVSGAPADFVSTHTYGAPPLDLRPILERRGRGVARIWWTEWGATPTHFNRVGDEAFAAAFLLRGMRSAAGRIDALSHWVASDHFEELGRPSSLLHGGFGLLFVGNLRKPRFRALQLLERLGDHELAIDLDGDGSGGMVEGWAARDDAGRIGIVVWNGTLDQSRAAGHAPLDRRVELTVDGLDAAAYDVHHWRVDAEHSNVAATWRRMGGDADWPDDAQWRALAAIDRLDELAPSRRVEPVGGTHIDAFDLPMPGISMIELVPVQ